MGINIDKNNKTKTILIPIKMALTLFLINRRWANNSQELHIDIFDNRITLYN